jgi:hypothetical protein
MCNDTGLRVRALLDQAYAEREPGRTDAMETLFKEFLRRGGNLANTLVRTLVVDSLFLNYMPRQ